MNFYVTICVLVISRNIEADCATEIDGKITKYFESALVKSFQDQWVKHQKSFENAVKLAIKENFGHRPMNVYMKSTKSVRNLAAGYYLSDNVIDLLLIGMSLRDSPYIRDPKVTFGLGGNALRLEGFLTKMFMDADYVLFRNKSDVLYSGVQDPYRHSPFSFQQVQPQGQLAIVAETCMLTGEALATLSGTSVNLGETTFKVSRCDFLVEIYTEGLGSPPVIAPYFSRKQSLQLESLLSKPVVTELMPKLQAAMFSFVNTSAIFGKSLPKYRHYQQKLLKATRDYMAKVVSNLNKVTVNKNQGVIKLSDLNLLWDDSYTQDGQETSISLANMTLNGLDSAYSAYKGGAFRTDVTKLVDEIRFNTLQVKGKMFFENTTTKAIHNFAAEIQDVSVSIQMNVGRNRKQQGKDFHVELLGWRMWEFTIYDQSLYIREQVHGHSIISGYLLSEISKSLDDYLNKALPKAAFGNVKISEGDESLSPNANDVENKVSNDNLDKNDLDDNKAKDNEGPNTSGKKNDEGLDSADNNIEEGSDKSNDEGSDNADKNVEEESDKANDEESDNAHKVNDKVSDNSVRKVVWLNLKKD